MMVQNSHLSVFKVLIFLCEFWCPPPHINVRTRIYRKHILHIVGKLNTNDTVAMHFQTDREIAFNRKDIVEVDDVIVSACDYEPIVSRKLNTSYLRRVPIFILFYQHKGLECSPVRWSLVHQKSIILGNSKQSSIVTELSTVYISLEIELCNNEVPFQVEDDSVAGKIYGNEKNSIRTGFYDANLIMGLEG